MVIRLILTQEQGVEGFTIRRAFHTFARLCLAQCEPRMQLSLSQALSLHRLSQIAPLKNITFQYKKLHYKLLYRKFNTLKKMPPWKTASEFQVCTG